MQQAPSQAATPKTPPLVPGIPLLGNLPKLLNDPFSFLSHCQQTHGDIYTLRLGPQEVVILNHPRHAQHVLRDHGRNYRKGGPLWDTARAIFGNGLILSEGDFWLRQRRMMQPQFHKQKIADLASLMADEIKKCLSDWDAAADKDTPLDLGKALAAMTMRVTVRAMWGAEMTAEAIDEVGDAMAFALDYILRGMVVKRLPSWAPIPGSARYRQAKQTIDRVVYTAIAKIREDVRSGVMSGNLLAALVQMTDTETGEGLTDQQIRDEVVNLFLAGYDTTAATLTWACSFLLRHPADLMRLRTECDSVLQGRTPTFADATRLTYTRMVVQETLRLRPAAWQVPRTAIEPDVIDGYSIAAGTVVIPLIYMIHRHPEHWHAPENFDPQRFSPGSSDVRHHFSWIPFGAGQRTCIGKEFSLLESQLVLASLFQRFALTPTAPEPPLPRMSATLKMHGAVNVRVQHRKP